MTLQYRTQRYVMARATVSTLGIQALTLSLQCAPGSVDRT